MMLTDSKFFQLTGTSHIISSACHPQMNGLVEWFNQTLQNSLHKSCIDCREEWDETLPSVLFPICTCVQKSVIKEWFISCDHRYLLLLCYWSNCLLSCFSVPILSLSRSFFPWTLSLSHLISCVLAIGTCIIKRSQIIITGYEPSIALSCELLEIIHLPLKVSILVS